MNNITFKQRGNNPNNFEVYKQGHAIGAIVQEGEHSYIYSFYKGGMGRVNSLERAKQMFLPAQ